MSVRAYRVNKKELAENCSFNCWHDTDVLYFFVDNGFWDGRNDDVLQDVDGDIHALTKPANGEFANETILMGCSQTLDIHIHSFEEYRLKSIAVFSDGLQRLSLRMPECEPHVQFFEPLFERLQNVTEAEMEKFLQEFLVSARVNNRTDDDKTIVAAHIV